jgi:hypothetical protein
LIRRLNLEYEKWVRDAAQEMSILIEFSRGVEHGGYQTAYDHLSDSILEKAACMYIQVSYQESLRKNRLRYNPERPYSILQHSLPDEKMARLYRRDDWSDFTADHPSFLNLRGFRVPYVNFENEDDVTTDGGSQLGKRLEIVLNRLWSLWQEQHGYN